MHKLNINVQVKGEVTEAQVVQMAMALYGQVNDYLRSLPIKSSPIVLPNERIAIGGEHSCIFN